MPIELTPRQVWVLQQEIDRSLICPDGFPRPPLESFQIVAAVVFPRGKCLLRFDCRGTDIGERFRVAYVSRAQGETSHHYCASKVPGKHIPCRLWLFAHILRGGSVSFMDKPIEDANNLIVLRGSVVLNAEIICPIPSVLLYYRVRRRRKLNSGSSLTLPRPGIAVDAPKLSQDPPALRGKKARRRQAETRSPLHQAIHRPECYAPEIGVSWNWVPLDCEMEELVKLQRQRSDDVHRRPQAWLLAPAR